MLFPMVTRKCSPTIKQGSANTQPPGDTTARGAHLARFSYTTNYDDDGATDSHGPSRRASGLGCVTLAGAGVRQHHARVTAGCRARPAASGCMYLQLTRVVICYDLLFFCGKLMWVI